MLSSLVIGIIVRSCGFLHVIGHELKLLHLMSGPVIEDQEARLVDSGRKVPFYCDLPTFEQIMHLDTEKAADIAQLQHFGETEAIFLLASGTRVRVLQANARHYLVRIIDGAYAGATGYVSAAFVQE